MIDAMINQEALSGLGCRLNAHAFVGASMGILNLQSLLALWLFRQGRLSYAELLLLLLLLLLLVVADRARVAQVVSKTVLLLSWKVMYELHKLLRLGHAPAAVKVGFAEDLAKTALEPGLATASLLTVVSLWAA